MKYDENSIITKNYLISHYDEVETKLKQTGEILIMSGESIYKLSVTNVNDLIRDKKKKSKMILPEAMIAILEREPDKTMHAKDIAERITEKELFFRKAGNFVIPIQVRACANNNKDLFDCLDRNKIKVK